MSNNNITANAVVIGAGATNYGTIEAATVTVQSGGTNTGSVYGNTVLEAGAANAGQIWGCCVVAVGATNTGVVDGPLITAVPQTQTVPNGSSATYTVAAAVTSGSVTYQWQVNNGGTGNWIDIVGQTSATLSFTADNYFQGSNLYRCIISDGAYTFTSDPVTLDFTGVFGTTVDGGLYYEYIDGVKGGLLNGAYFNVLEDNLVRMYVDGEDMGPFTSTFSDNPEDLSSDPTDTDTSRGTNIYGQYGNWSISNLYKGYFYKDGLPYTGNEYTYTAYSPYDASYNIDCDGEGQNCQGTQWAQKYTNAGQSAVQFNLGVVTAEAAGSVSVDGSNVITHSGVNLTNSLAASSITELVYSNVIITGDFNISNNNLANFKNSPISVGGNLNVSNNPATTLKGLPSTVGGSFDCIFTSIPSFDGGPSSVGASYIANNSGVVSLSGIPSIINGDLLLNSCTYLTSFAYGPSTVTGFMNIASSGINSLVGAPDSVGSLNVNTGHISFPASATSKNGDVWVYRNSTFRSNTSNKNGAYSTGYYENNNIKITYTNATAQRALDTGDFYTYTSGVAALAWSGTLNGYYSYGYLVDGVITATAAGIHQIVNGDQKYYNFNSNGTKGSLASGYTTAGYFVSGVKTGTGSSYYHFLTDSTTEYGLYDSNGDYSTPVIGFYSVGYLYVGSLVFFPGLSCVRQAIDDLKYYQYDRDTYYSSNNLPSFAADGYYDFGYIVNGVLTSRTQNYVTKITQGAGVDSYWYKYNSDGTAIGSVTGVHRFKNTSGVYSSVVDVAGDNWYVFDVNGAATIATGLLEHTNGKLYDFGTSLNNNTPTLLQGVRTYNGHYVDFGTSGLSTADADSGSYSIYDTYQIWDNVEGHQIGVSGGKYYYFNKEGNSAILMTNVWADTEVSDWYNTGDSNSYQITARIDGALKDYGVNGTASPSLASVGLHKVNYVYTSTEASNGVYYGAYQYIINSYPYGNQGQVGYPVETAYAINVPSTGASMSASLGMSTGSATYYTGTAFNLEGDSKYHYYIAGTDQGLASGNYKRGLTSTVYTYASGVEGSSYTGVNYYVVVNGVNTYYSVTAGTVGALLNGYYSVGYFVDGVKTGVDPMVYSTIVDGNNRFMAFDSNGDASEVNGYYSFGYVVNGIVTATTSGTYTTVDTGQSRYFFSSGAIFDISNGLFLLSTGLYFNGDLVPTHEIEEYGFLGNVVYPTYDDSYVYFTRYQEPGYEDIISTIHILTEALSTYEVYLLSFAGLTSEQKDAANNMLALAASITGPGDGVIGIDGVVYIDGEIKNTSEALIPVLSAGVYRYNNGLKYTGITSIAGVYKYVYNGTPLNTLASEAIRLPADNFKYHYFVAGVDQGLASGVLKCPEFNNNYRSFSAGVLVSASNYFAL